MSSEAKLGYSDWPNSQRTMVIRRQAAEAKNEVLPQRSLNPRARSFWETELRQVSFLSGLVMFSLVHSLDSGLSLGLNLNILLTSGLR